MQGAKHLPGLAQEVWCFLQGSNARICIPCIMHALGQWHNATQQYSHSKTHAAPWRPWTTACTRLG